MTVRIERDGPIATVTLARPEKRNAFDGVQTRHLDDALNQLDDDPAARVILLAADGPAFSAGTDLAVGSGGRTGRGGYYGITDRRRATPVIAVVEGPAIGGGFEVVLSCDLVVASSNASFALPEVTRGVVATCGALFRLPRVLTSAQALEMLLLGDPISAEQAHTWGIVNRVTNPGGALAEAQEMARRILRNSPAAIEATLRAVQSSLASAEGIGWHATEAAARTVLASPDSDEGKRAFLEKRAPRWA